MRLSGVTTDPDTLYKREKPVRILDSTNIYFGADGSNWLIKFGVLVTFYVLIDSLGILYFF